MDQWKFAATELSILLFAILNIRYLHYYNMLMKEQIKNSNHKDIIELLRRIIFAILHIRLLKFSKTNCSLLSLADFAEQKNYFCRRILHFQH